MSDFLVFAGTTEGREISEFLARGGAQVKACVATEYGSEMLKPEENLTVLEGRLSSEEIEKLLNEKFDLVIDATHPYAQKVSEEVKRACEDAGVPRLRVLREESSFPEESVFVRDAREALDFLNGQDGNILLTTGMKDLETFSRVRDYEKRVFARVLPSASSIEACKASGLPSSHIIAMQGPFSLLLNQALIQDTKASFLVTKDSGKAGGTDEKIRACALEGCVCVVIGRPHDTGMSLSKALTYLEETFGIKPAPSIILIGTGPGGEETLTKEARDAIARSDAVIGAGRLEKLAQGRPFFKGFSEADIRKVMEKNPHFRSIAVLLTGDTGFFSGAKKLIASFGPECVRILPGISSLSYLSSKSGISYDDAFLSSAHGRTHHVENDVSRHKKVFCLTGGAEGMSSLIFSLVEAGLGEVRMTVGERLGYEDEKIHRGRAKELLGRTFDSLSCAFIENDSPYAILTQGLEDDKFIRGGSEGKPVPMTKSEARAVILSKMKLAPCGTYVDIGSGSGSVSVEIARTAPESEVYAIEKDEAALDLTRRNVEKFRLENVKIVPGEAPEALDEIPAADVAFIGGSSGKLEGIISSLVEKNPDIRIVVSAVTLESAAEMTRLLKLFRPKKQEVVTLNVSRARKAGPYHLMMAQNPVTIFTFEGLTC